MWSSRASYRSSSPSPRSFTKRRAITISMDGKGCSRDNVFVERLWKTIKYEHVYLHAYQTVAEARAKVATYFEFYSRRRPRAALDGRTPTTCTSVHCRSNRWLNLQCYTLKNPEYLSNRVGPPLSSLNRCHIIS
jgi:integrase-like protein